MASLEDYFKKNRNSVKFHIGDRVKGLWNGIPFRGTVLIEHTVDDEKGPVVHIQSDLPISYNGGFYMLISTCPGEVQMLL